jgi:rhodanese-related sulfurtransferase
MPANASDLSQLYPLDSLRPENLEQLAREAEIEEVGRGAVLFSAGDVDDFTIYLLAGQAVGRYPDGKRKTTDGGALQGRYPLGDLQPRRFTCTVESLSATLVRLDRRFVEKIITWDQLSRSENFRHYDPEPGSNRWVYRLLQNRALHKMPTGNIERMFLRFEQIPVAAGDVIVREGDAADYFYVIKDGTCAVSKRTEQGDAVVAYLVRGDTFGEDALLTNSTRNATVAMKTEGKLMRLSSKNFTEVLKPPVVDWVTPGQASILVRQGALVVDVRLPEEFSDRAVKGALNVPLYVLREKAQDFERGRKVVVYCNTGERSAAAAFILGKIGVPVFALQGGLSAMIRTLEKQAAEKREKPAAE